MSTPTVTYTLAMSAARDEANRHMRAAGRFTSPEKPGEGFGTMSAPNYPLRLDPLRRAGWKRAAELEGRTLAGWIKRVCDRAAEQAETREAERDPYDDPIYVQQMIDRLSRGTKS